MKKIIKKIKHVLNKLRRKRLEKQLTIALRKMRVLDTTYGAITNRMDEKCITMDERDTLKVMRLKRQVKSIKYLEKCHKIEALLDELD